MSPAEVLKMTWVFFLSLLDYKNNEIEKDNKAMQEQERKLRRG